MSNIIDFGSRTKKKLQAVERVRHHLEHLLQQAASGRADYLKEEIASLNWLVGEYVRYKTMETLSRQASDQIRQKGASACGDSLAEQADRLTEELLHDAGFTIEPEEPS